MFGEYRGEFQKITWPTRKELIKQTVTVMITCVIFSIIIFGMDFVLNFGVGQFAQLISAGS